MVELHPRVRRHLDVTHAVHLDRERELVCVRPQPLSRRVRLHHRRHLRPHNAVTHRRLGALEP
eukprot:9876334-Prorocentrum_lima.AAC.1